MEPNGFELVQKVLLIVSVVSELNRYKILDFYGGEDLFRNFLGFHTVSIHMWLQTFLSLLVERRC